MAIWIFEIQNYLYSNTIGLHDFDLGIYLQPCRFEIFLDATLFSVESLDIGK